MRAKVQTRHTQKAARGGEDAAMTQLSPTLLLLSSDQSLVDCVNGAISEPWKLAHHTTYTGNELFGQANVRMVVFDDEAVAEQQRVSLLARIQRQIPGVSLLYIAGNHNHENEVRARASGAHYYTSKPLAFDHFDYVLRSFLRARTSR